jgi:hypothetical protein
MSTVQTPVPQSVNNSVNIQSPGPQVVAKPIPPKPNMATSRPVLRSMTPQVDNSQAPKKGKKGKMFLGIFLVIILGIGSGYALTMMTGKGATASGLKEEKGLKREVSTDEIKAGTKVGIADEKTFRDSAEGTVEKGGIDGEGSHKLIRPGGEDQTLFMTSSVIDLDQFNGRKVKVWGETIGAQKAGWLMDVGKLEVLE